MGILKEYLGAIILSAGGTGVVIIALSSFIGRIWANRFMESQKGKITKDIERYKQELDVELKRLTALQDKATYVSKTLYDKEFEIYLTMWDKLIELSFVTYDLFAVYVSFPEDVTEYYKYRVDKYNKYSSVYNDYISYLRKNGPFLDQIIEVFFSEYREVCEYQGIAYAKFMSESFVEDGRDLLLDMDREERKVVTIDHPQRMNEIESKLKTAIREHLRQLQVA